MQESIPIANKARDDGSGTIVEFASPSWENGANVVFVWFFAAMES